MSMKSSRNYLKFAIRHFLYPLLALSTVAYLALELSGPRETLGKYYGIFLPALLLVMVLIELAHELQPQWRMTWTTFLRRDVPFMVLGASTLAATNLLATRIITEHALTPGGLMTSMPLVPGVVLCILVTDFLWYWLHRYSHEARGCFDGFFWKTHLAHHLPQQVYMLMHPIGHPINAVFVRAILTVPPFFMGFSAEVVFAASVITGLQGLVSHFNVDSRAGWINHVLMGTELHRYHHSSDATEAQNFGGVVSVWDQLFGTFFYRPAELPVALGLSEPERYPTDTQILKVLAVPWRNPE